MSQAPRAPSVASLATALSRTESVAPRSRHRVAIARPPPRERALMWVTMVALPLLAAGILLLAVMLWQFILAARAELDARERAVREALPADAVLLDESGWRHEAAGRPLAAGNLLLARCRLLAGERRWDDLEASVASVAQTDPGSILPATRLLRAEALLGLGRGAEAGAQLDAIVATALDAEGRASLAILAARTWTAAPRSALRPAEQPQQAAPE